MVPAASDRISPVPSYSGTPLAWSPYVYGAITLCGRPFQSVRLQLPVPLCGSYNPGAAVTAPVWAGPRSLATTWGITVVFSSSGYLDVSVPRVSSLRLCIQRSVTRLQRAGLPHSEIHGSKLACSSPRLIAAYHVLLRLLMPRHPPCALLYPRTRSLYLHPVSCLPAFATGKLSSRCSLH